MREGIGLYRGKRKDNGEWVYGYLGVFKGIWQIFVPFTEEEEKANEGHIFSAIGGLWYTVFPESVGEYTGLPDKNGKKIFEGDILKGAWETIFQVVYDDCYLGFRAKEKDGMHNCIDYYGFDCIEVIGNIHDNSELLQNTAN